MLSHPLAWLGSQHRILSLVQSGETVLDVGCATGYLGEALRRAKGCRVVGVDIDAAAAIRAAEVLDEAFVWDIESDDPLPVPQGVFDRIILGDVLEHLRRPDRALARLVAYLREGGTMIASIPNVGYLPVRVSIVLGRFEYQDLGHFDRTHLRFFTRKTAMRLFELSGLRVLRMYNTGIAAVIPLWPTLLAAKFVLVAAPLEAMKDRTV